VGENLKSMALAMENEIELRHVTKAYGNLVAVKDVSLALPKGMVFGLLGPNGAGKTTLVNMLTTLLKPTSGSASVGGYDVVREAARVRSLIGVVPQENNLDRYLTARENLILHAKMHRMIPSSYHRRIDELLSLTGLVERQKDFPNKFSTGMQRRLVVARALVHDPQILFLDEPTTGLDPQAKRAIWDYFLSLKGKRTLFLTTHNMEEADFPPDLRDAATSLRIRAGRAFRRVDVLARLLDAFGTRYAEFIGGGFASLRDGWDRRDFLRGRRVLHHLRGLALLARASACVQQQQWSSRKNQIPTTCSNSTVFLPTKPNGKSWRQSIAAADSATAR